MAARNPAEKTRWAFGHPVQKRPQPVRPAQGLDRGKAARQFRFGKACVHLLVADVVQQYHFAPFAALQPRHQMMQALRHIRWNGAQAQRAKRVCHLVSNLIWCHRMARLWTKTRAGA